MPLGNETRCQPMGLTGNLDVPELVATVAE